MVWWLRLVLRCLSPGHDILVYVVRWLDWVVVAVCYGTVWVGWVTSAFSNLFLIGGFYQF